MPQHSEDTHPWKQRLLTLAKVAIISSAVDLNASDLNASVFAAVNQCKDFRRFRSFCEAVGLKPPDGASEPEAAAWWLRLLEQPQEYHDRLWRLFADYIRETRQIVEEIGKRDREREAQLTEWAKRSNVDPRWLRAELPSLLTDWVKRKNVTIARLAEAKMHLEDRLKSQEGVTELSKFSRAMAQLVAHPDWTNEKIAEAAGCHVKSLPRMRLFSDARKLLKEQGKTAMLRGSKRRKQKSEQATVEAWNGPADDDAR